MSSRENGIAFIGRFAFCILVFVGAALMSRASFAAQKTGSVGLIKPTGATVTPTLSETITATSTLIATGTATSTPSPMASPTGSATPRACDSWYSVGYPGIGYAESVLYGISAVSAADIWAVGMEGRPGAHSLTMHWDGSAWSVVPNPDPGADLRAVSALSHNDVWAVGGTLAMHWDGSAWSVAGTPNPGTSTLLDHVVALAPDDVWASGQYQDGSVYRSLTMHYDGAQWSIVPVPTLSLIHGLVGFSRDDVWATCDYTDDGTNRYISIHWDGTQWSIVPSPGLPQVSGISGAAGTLSSDLWTSGYVNGQLVMLHWDGSDWSVVPSNYVPPDPTVETHVNGMVATSLGDAWAVGEESSSDPQTPFLDELILHWDGTRWGQLPGAYYRNADRPSLLIGVTAVSAYNVWAVGQYADASPPLALIERRSEMPFTDVQPSDYFYNAVSYLYCAGAISGYADGSFRPYTSTTRGQLCKIVVLAEQWSIDTTGGPHFSDVLENNPFYGYIETAYNHDVVSGYADGTFRWGNGVTRAQLCKIVVNAEGWAIDTTGGPHFFDVPETNPFYSYVETAYNHNIISGYSDGTFRPGNNATRGQISKIVYNSVTQH